MDRLRFWSKFCPLQLSRFPQCQVLKKTSPPSYQLIHSLYWNTMTKTFDLIGLFLQFLHPVLVNQIFGNISRQILTTTNLTWFQNRWKNITLCKKRKRKKRFHFAHMERKKPHHTYTVINNTCSTSCTCAGFLADIWCVCVCVWWAKGDASFWLSGQRVMVAEWAGFANESGDFALCLFIDSKKKRLMFFGGGALPYQEGADASS